MKASTVFSRDFVKVVGGFLQTSTANGDALTRPDLAKFIRKTYGQTLNADDLNVWLSASVNLGLFDTDIRRYITKRGVGGGIVQVAAPVKKAPAKKAAIATAPKAKATKKAAVKRTPKVEQPAPVETPVVSSTAN